MMQRVIEHVCNNTLASCTFHRDVAGVLCFDLTRPSHLVSPAGAGNIIIYFLCYIEVSNMVQIATRKDTT